jgi:hypothetical protein
MRLIATEIGRTPFIPYAAFGTRLATDGPAAAGNLVRGPHAASKPKATLLRNAISPPTALVRWPSFARSGAERSLVMAVRKFPAAVVKASGPDISHIPDQTIGISSVLTTVPFAVSDPETPADKLSVTGSSSDTALVLNANIVFGGTGASRTVTITPAAQKSGATTITISVQDEAGGQATANFLLTVTRARRAPSLDSLPDLDINEDAPAQTVNLTGIGVGTFKEAGPSK